MVIIVHASSSIYLGGLSEEGGAMNVLDSGEGQGALEYFFYKVAHLD